MCEKQRYESQKQAIRAVLSYSRKRGVALRVYRCPLCKAWHLTRRKSWASKRPAA